MRRKHDNIWCEHHIKKLRGENNNELCSGELHIWTPHCQLQPCISWVNMHTLYAVITEYLLQGHHLRGSPQFFDESEVTPLPPTSQCASKMTKEEILDMIFPPRYNPLPLKQIVCWLQTCELLVMQGMDRRKQVVGAESVQCILFKSRCSQAGGTPGHKAAGKRCQTWDLSC